MPRFASIFMLMLCTVLLGGASTHGLGESAGEESPKVVAGERLVYEAKWGAFKVATAEVTVEGPVDVKGQACYKFNMDVRTNSFADAIFKVRDTFTGYAASDLSRSYLYEQREQHHKDSAEIDVFFNHETGESHMVRDGADSGTMAIEPGSLDPITAVFAARLQEYVANSEFAVNVADGKRSGPLKVKVGESEEVKTKLGKFDALLMEPDLSEFHHHFKENKKAYIKLWVADDEAKTPVMLEAKVKWAKIKIKLVEHERP